ncbi:hypothetical protein STANM337S_06543 [Streptomyces tanashiensis]
MSVTPAGPASRVGRNHTKGRTHPWVLGKLGDFVLWFGPCNAGQLVIAAVGVLVLIKTFDWWSGLGPLPVLALGVVVWAARAHRVGGRRPMWVLYGLARRALQPRSGRIGGKAARPPGTHRLTGTLLIDPTTDPTDPIGPIGPTEPAGFADSIRSAGPVESSARSASPAGSDGARKRSVPRPAVRPSQGRRAACSGPAAPAPAPEHAPEPARVAVRASARVGGGPVPTPLQQMLHDRSKRKAAAR